MVAEESTWGSFAFARRAMSDPVVARQIGILAAHNYDQRDPTRPPAFRNTTTQRVWQTEVSTFDGYEGTMANALVWARRIHFFLSKAHVSAFHYWYLSAAPNARVDNEALTGPDGNVAKRAYAIAHWSRFVRPGWREVDVTDASSPLISAFESEDRSDFAIVAVNAARAATTVRISIGARHSLVTPWITSTGESLTRHGDVHAADGVLSYELPASSIATFVGRIDPP
jgi:O-glycosyl hydrolase